MVHFEYEQTCLSSSFSVLNYIFRLHTHRCINEFTYDFLKVKYPSCNSPTNFIVLRFFLLFGLYVPKYWPQYYKINALIRR